MATIDSKLLISNGLKPGFTPGQAIIDGKLKELKSAAENPQKLKETADDFEAIFVYYMLKTMRKTIMKSGLLDSGISGEIMESMFDQELAQTIASHSRLGIAELLQDQLQDKGKTNLKELNQKNPAVSMDGESAVSVIKEE